MNEIDLKSGLKTKKIGKEILYFKEVSSTNEIARQHAEKGTIAGTVIISETQTTGRGRRGRTWESPAGGLWFTIVLRPKLAPIYAPIITLMTGVACASAIEKITSLKATLKWPNDVHIKGKKVCGILTEISSEPDNVKYILVGLGINVNNEHSEFPENLRAQVTSLLHELKEPVNLNDLFQELLLEFENLYFPFVEDPVNNIPLLINSWGKISDTIGRDVKIETISGSMVGLAVEITEDGSLLIQTHDGKKERIIAGDCIYLDQRND
jgi:BirA family biotin operon repressor/biotin-[acetyl-CoA-carboxylase] ligase